MSPLNSVFAIPRQDDYTRAAQQRICLRFLHGPELDDIPACAILKPF